MLLVRTRRKNLLPDTNPGVLRFKALDELREEGIPRMLGMLEDKRYALVRLGDLAPGAATQ